MRSEGNKIYQMDCLDFLRQQEDEQFDLIVTSPPYNYGGFSRNGRKKQYDTYSDDMPVEDYQKWIGEILTECARVLKQGGAMYWNHKGKFEDYQFKHCFWIIDKCPLYFAQHITWKFPASPDVAKIKWYPRKEDVFYFTKGKPKYYTYRKADIVKWLETYTCDVERPIISWTTQQVFEYIIDNGFMPNKLYQYGFTRVGCFPCIMCTKDEIAKIIEYRPEKIEYIKQLEIEMGSTFFPPDYIPARYCSKQITKVDEETGKQKVVGIPSMLDVVKYVQAKQYGSGLFVGSHCQNQMLPCE